MTLNFAGDVLHVTVVIWPFVSGCVCVIPSSLPLSAQYSLQFLTGFFHTSHVTWWWEKVRLGYCFTPYQRRNSIDFCLQVQRSTFAFCMWNLVDTIQAALFVRSLSNFACKLMGGGGTRLVLVLKAKVNVGILHARLCGHDTGCSFCPIAFILHT